MKVEKKDNLWFNHTSVEENEEYIVKLLNRFKISTYNFVYNNGQLDLVFSWQTSTYKCNLDKDEQCLILWKRNMVGNIRQKEHYHLVKKIYGSDCWYDTFKHVQKR